MTVRVTVGSADAMRDLGRRIATLLHAGDLVLLIGPLGSGKTTLAQGIGRGLRVREPITSPTFVIARAHASRSTGPPMVHADLYRLGGVLEFDDLDLDASTADSVTVVEWGEGLAEALADDRLEVRLERPLDAPGDCPEPRVVTITGRGRRWADVDLAAVTD
jgi:tRNA threonylcarbamoyladenosine biosynthesis protein TsaE